MTSRSGAIDHERLWRVLERFASTLVRDFDLDEVMEELGADVSAVVPVTGAGVMVEDPSGDLRFVSTSDETLEALERLQIELDEGPCLLAFRTGETVLSPDLRDDDRFAAFAAKATEAGMASVFSLPLRRRDTVVGGLNLYGHEPGPLGSEQLEVARTLADVASAYLLHHREVEAAQQLNVELEHALGTRVVVEQAKGFVAGRTGRSPDEARDLLRAHARRHQRRLHDVAEDVIAGRLEIDHLR